MKTQRGYTLIELMLVLAIMLILLRLTTISLSSSQQKVSTTEAEQVLLTDLRQQQLKAMIGDTEGRSEQDAYGVHFDLNQYVLFHGTYTPADPANFTVDLNQGLQFNPAGTDIIFQRISGEIPVSSISVDLENTTNGETKIMVINKYGVVTQGD